jgi:hypothetical protein
MNYAYFYADGQLLGYRQTAPYQWDWDTRTVLITSTGQAASNGPNVISAVIESVTGSQESDSITVLVAN